jgi:hypothetical protein
MARVQAASRLTSDAVPKDVRVVVCGAVALQAVALGETPRGKSPGRKPAMTGAGSTKHKPGH